MNRGTTLVEVLIVTVIISILATFVLSVTAKAYRRMRITIIKVQSFHNMRLNSFAAENQKQQDADWLATNTPKTFAPDNYFLIPVK